MIPKGWKDFSDKYVSNLGYWYVPKGLTIKEDNLNLIRKRLRILKTFEGRKWGRVQGEYVNTLIKRGLFERRAKKQTKPDRSAIGRMFKVVGTTLGLAWVDGEDEVAITNAGNNFISSDDFGIIYNQINRYQFYNPSLPGKAFNDFRVIPVLFVCEVLLGLRDQKISKEEYVLFISRKKSLRETGVAIEEVEQYRVLSGEKRRALIDHLNSVYIRHQDPEGETRRSSIYNTITLDSPYALQFLGASELLEYDERELRLGVTEKEARAFVKDWTRRHSWIDFKAEKDWFYYFGNPDIRSSTEFAVEYYADISDIENGLAAFDRAKDAGVRLPDYSKKEFESILIDESLLEQFLEKHLATLEPGLKLVPRGRQYSTIVGPIDLLAKDKNGCYVVIELKRGRVADKVIGQVTRYVGFVGSTLTNLKKVRAIIVGKNIDKSLVYATKCLKFACSLYEFDFQFAFSKLP